MSNSTASLPQEPQLLTNSPPILHTLRRLYSRVTSPGYTHDANPWSDSDPALQSIFTTSLELLQEHADFHMRAFLYVHELLDKELVDRKLATQTLLGRVSGGGGLLGSSNVREVLFDVEELVPLSGFLEPLDQGHNVRGTVVGERIDAMARMAYAWVDSDRSTSAARRRAGSRPSSVKFQAPRDAAFETMTEPEEARDSDQEGQCVPDMIELRAEMDGFDPVVDDGESFSRGREYFEQVKCRLLTTEDFKTG